MYYCVTITYIERVVIATHLCSEYISQLCNGAFSNSFLNIVIERILNRIFMLSGQHRFYALSALHGIHSEAQKSEAYEDAPGISRLN